MNASPHRTLFIRIGIIVLSVALLAHSLITLVNFFGAPTDENIFRDVPTRFMAVRSFPAQLDSRRSAVGARVTTVATSLDSVMTGDLVLSINDGTVKTMKDIADIIDESPVEMIRFEVLRPAINEVLVLSARRSVLPKEFLVRLPSYVLVQDVTPGGASDRAGMKVGDLIIRINKKEFTSAGEADQILRLGQIGKSLQYDILRNNQFVELNVVLAKFGIPLSLLFFSLTGMFWMVVGAFIAASRPQLIAARLLGLSFILIGFVLSVLVVRRAPLLTAEVIVQAVIMGMCAFVGLGVYFHSMLYFPKERSDILAHSWVVPGYYLSITIAAVIVAMTNGAVWILLPFLFVSFVMFRFRKSCPPEYKRLNRAIRWSGWAAMGLLVIFFFVSRETLQSTNGLAVYAAAALLPPLAVLYTIGRFRLLDLNFRVRRNTQYSIVTFLWATAVIYALVWGFFQLPSLQLPAANIVFTGTAIEVNDAPELASQRAVSEHLMLMALAVVLFFFLLAVRRWGQRFIDRFYFRQQYDYRKSALELGELLGTTMSAQELASGLVQKLAGLMKLKRAAVVFFRDEERISSLSVVGFDGTSCEAFCRSHQKEIITLLRQFINEVRVEYLPGEVKAALQQEGFQYGVPIRSKDRLVGVLFVGEKESETVFRQEDLTFLTSAAKQSSAAIENAFLYEELAEKERMRHELEIARRIQLDSLPQSTPVVGGLEISGTSIPAMEVGGDFFDYLSNSVGRFTVVIGDVSGKGTSAALYMSKVQGILRSLHGFDLPPKDLFRRANRLLCQDLEKRSFVTVLGAEFDTAAKSLVVSRAGHLPLWHYSAAKGTVVKVLPKGLGLGLNDASIFANEMEERTLSYHAGDLFLFATDGVIEAHTESGDFGEERLLRAFSVQPDASAKEILGRILADLKDFVGDREQHDDQTLVIVKAVDG